MPKQAVYVREDGSEFIVRHFGRVDAETHEIRYLEGELNGDKVAFITSESLSELRTTGRFVSVFESEYARRARYEVEWYENPNREADMALFSEQAAPWKGEWKLIRCDGKSDRAVKLIQAAHRLNCPVDRISFIDENTGRQFNVEKYAEEFSYLHKGQIRDTPPRDKSGRPTWTKRVGYWVMEGKLDGSQAYLVYQQIQGTPCCSLRSYNPGDHSLANLTPRWISGRAVPTITNLNRGEFIFEEIGVREGAIYQMGPVTGMRLVPVACNMKTRADSEHTIQLANRRR